VLLDQYVDSPDHVALLRAAWDGFAAALPASQATPEAPALTGTDPVADLRLFRTSYLAAAARAGSSRQAQARLAYAALRKMTESLDDCHTAFMDPVQAEEQMAGLRGESRFGGVGVRIKQRPNQPALVWEILPGGSAGKAGIKPGDAVIKINGQDVSSLTLQQIAAAIRGPEGSQVTLTVQRSDGKKVQEFSLKRGPVVDPPFQSKTLPGNVGYFRLNSFSDTTNRDLLQAVRALESKNPKGWIVDLRTNGGGDLSAVLSLMSKFLKNGPFGFEVDKRNQPSAFGPDGSYLPRQHPLVVLVSESSASGAELFAAAIQQYKAGTVIGTKTAGCVGLGSTLQLADGSAVTVTTSKLLGPTQNEMNKLGLVPAEVVDVSRADLAASRDPQLQRALAVLGAPTK
jgi:carboxyl-terminal processing protease